MSSLKQLIINAVIKVSLENPARNLAGEPTHEEARDMFIAALVAELFPPEEPVVVEAVVQIPMVSVPVASPAKKLSKEEIKAAKEAEKAAEKAAKEAAKEAEKKAKEAAKEAEKKAKEAAKLAEKQAKEAEKAAKIAATPPKKSPEEKKAEKEAEKQAKEAAKLAEKQAKEAAKLAEKEAKEAAKEAEKKAKEEAKAAEKAAKEAAKKSPAEIALPASPKPKKAKAEKPAEDANVQKIDPTWRKHLKAAAKTAGKEHSKEMESELLTYLNGLTKEAFNATKAEEHAKAFFGSESKPAAAPAPAPVQETVAELDAIEIDFNGKTYYVNPESKRVYEQDGEVFKGVGYAGMAAFAEMEIPEDA